MNADRSVRAAAAVKAALDFLSVGDRSSRYLAQHRADDRLCVSCGEPFPCSVAGLALAARDRAARAKRKTPGKRPESPPDASGAVRRWPGPAARPEDFPGHLGGAA